MGKRTVGEGRGSVYAGGRVFVEGDEIPADVEVGDHVFDDVDDTGNVGLGPNVAAGAHRLVVTDPTAEDDGGSARKSTGARKS
jgi:hypothetical protein